MRKYLEIFKYSLKMQTAFLTNYIFSFFSFAIHVFIFNELWDYILKGKSIIGYSRPQLIWYIIIAEFVTMAVRRTHKIIGEMVKNGEIANMLIKPIDFIAYHFFQDISVIIQAIINFIFAIILGFILVGSIPFTIPQILICTIAILVAIVTSIFLQIFVGLLSFITEENDSFWLIIQKLSFFAVFTPVEFYPIWAQKILFLLPTTYFIYTPAKLFVHFNLVQGLKLLGLEILSLVFIIFITRLLYKKGVEKINVNGG